MRCCKDQVIIKKVNKLKPDNPTNRKSRTIVEPILIGFLTKFELLNKESIIPFALNSYKGTIFDRCLVGGVTCVFYLLLCLKLPHLPEGSSHDDVHYFNFRLELLFSRTSYWCACAIESVTSAKHNQFAFLSTIFKTHQDQLLEHVLEEKYIY